MVNLALPLLRRIGTGILLAVYVMLSAKVVVAQADYSSAYPAFKQAERMYQQGQYQEAKSILSGVTQQGLSEGRVCVRYEIQKKHKRGAGGVWIIEEERVCAEMANYEPSKLLQSTENQILAAASAAAEAQKKAAAVVDRSTAQFRVAFTEQVKDGVLDALEAISFQFSVASLGGVEQLSGARVRIQSEPAGVIEDKSVSFSEIAEGRTLSVPTVLARGARAGSVKFTVTLEADNMNGALAEEAIGRVRN